MKTLDKALRSKLENTIIKARDIAETAAEAALDQLTVGNKTAGSHLIGDQRTLRNRLRSHGRLVGDILSSNGEQATRKLTTEVAYEHWHRMLFSRFLAENNLLMYSDGQTPLSLDDCHELAKDPDEKKQARNGWELAGIYAASMLPQIFRPGSPVFELKFAPEYQRELEHLLSELDADVFLASDSLGWVYQFWQSKKKEQVNKSEVKIGADELSAVTQLFTEPYMVSFLLDNALGAWWVSNFPEHRHVVELEYLRTLDNGKPAAGEFEGWPNKLSELKILDPCCGSGHFLVAVFLMLVPMRMAAEKLSARDAIDRVLKENIHGLELDQRCVELAAFALALTAWRYPDKKGEATGYRPLPELHLACSGQGINTSLKEWKALAEGDATLEHGLEQLYNLFVDAPTLGSLINPQRVLGNDLLSAEWKKVRPLVKKALEGNKSHDQKELGITAQGIAKAADLLSGKYHFVVTNVPYLARGKQSDFLKDFSADLYPAAKGELATVFVERIIEFCNHEGASSIVLPQNWLFLVSYKKFRKNLLSNCSLEMIATLGAQAFQTPMWDFNVQLLIFRNIIPNTTHQTCGLDVSDYRSPKQKAKELLTQKRQNVKQSDQLKNPDSRIIFGEKKNTPLLSEHANSLVGLQTGDDPMFISAFWEFHDRNADVWDYMQGTPDEYVEYAGLSWVVRWENANGRLFSLPTAYPTKGLKAVGRAGVALHRMGKLYAYHYSKEKFHQNIATIIPHDPSHLSAIWCFCSSSDFHDEVRKIDQKLNVTNATLVKVPFDLEHWQKVAAEKYPNGLPAPYSDDPTQWIFHGHPCKATEPLQVAVARLLGYRWPAELDEEMELSDDARTLIDSCQTLNPLSDDDGIVCIPPVRGEKSAADRLNELLLKANTAPVAKLLEQAQCKGKSLDVWLRDKFFEQHCKLFHHRPFIWHIWDGQKDGFSALVNYHKLSHKTMEALVYTYLGSWIRAQEQQSRDKVDGADIRLQAARQLEAKLKAVIEGEAPLDIFVRWKPLKEQPIGWNPDLNDGVRLNIRPLMLCGDVGKKGAGVLRAKPNIHWKKDRGKDVDSAPWYEKFCGERINDYHLQIKDKQAARADAKANEETVA